MALPYIVKHKLWGIDKVTLPVSNAVMRLIFSPWKLWVLAITKQEPVLLKRANEYPLAAVKNHDGTVFAEKIFPIIT